MCSIKTLLIFVLIFNCFSQFNANEIDDNSPSDDRNLLGLPLDLINNESLGLMKQNVSELLNNVNDFSGDKQNSTKIKKILDKLKKSPLFNSTVNKVKQKVMEFTKGVRWNLKSFVNEYRNGLNDGTSDQIRNTLLAFIDSLELSPLCLVSFVMMNKGLSSGELWPLKCTLLERNRFYFVV